MLERIVCEEIEGFLILRFHFNRSLSSRYSSCLNYRDFLLGVGGTVERKKVGGFEATGGTGRKAVADRPGEKERGRRKRKTKKRSGKRKGDLHNFFFINYAIKV